MQKGRLLKFGGVILIGLVILTSSLLVYKKYASAIVGYDKNECITFEEYTVETAIPKGTMFKGIYLIDVHCIDDEKILAMAKESAKDSEQERIYYRSEIGDGKWFDITEAEGIEAIERDAKEVDPEVMNGLLVRYYVDEAGNIFDITQKLGADIYTDEDFYNLWDMHEYDPLKAVYEDYSKSNIEKEYIDFMSSYLSMHEGKKIDGELNVKPISEDVEYCKKNYDEVIKVLMKKYELFNQSEDSKNKTYASTIDEIVQMINAQKKVYYYNKILENSVKYNDTLIKNADVYDGLNESLTEVKTSISEAEDTSVRIPDNDSEVIDRKIYDAYMGFLDITEHTDNEEVKKLCQKYQDLKNIRDGNVEDAESELKELAPIIDEAFENFSYFVCNGLSAAVETQVEDEAYMQMLAQIDYNKTNAEKARSELQNMISAKKDRVEENIYKEYAVSRMMVTIELYPKVEIDEYTDVANPIISEHVAWLYSEFLSGSDEDGSKIEDGEVSSLEERKEILEEAKEEALENNQNKEADDIDKLLDDLNSKLDDASGGENDGTSGALSKVEVDKELKEKLVSEAEKNSTNKRGFATCLMRLGDTNGAIEMLGDEYGEDHDAGYVNIQSYFNGEDDLEGNLDSFAKELDNINGLNNDIKNKTKDAINKAKSNLGIDEVGELQGALKDLKESTDGLSNEDKMKINGNVDKIEMELSDLLNSYNDKFVKPDEEKKGLDDAALENLLSEYTGTAEGRIIVTVVLDRLIQKGYSSYTNLCLKNLRYCVKEVNPYLQYTQYDKDGTEYAQLYTISAANDFRYIFSDDDTKVVLSNYPSSEKYMFELGDNQVRRENKKYSNLKKKIIFAHNDMYISEKDCKKNFKFVVEPVITCKYSDSYYSALFNDDMEKEAQEIEKQILGTE